MSQAVPEGSRIPSTSAIVDQAIEAVPQSLFSATGVPLAGQAEILAALTGPALRAVLDARVELRVKHGHSAEGDLMLAITALPKAAKDYAQMAVEAIGVTGRDRNLGLARRRLARSAALILAAIDRIDAAMAQ
ncbi:MAG: hypothetical protein V4502_13230 [Pseudomonadota bacterium]